MEGPPEIQVVAQKTAPILPHLNVCPRTGKVRLAILENWPTGGKKTRNNNGQEANFFTSADNNNNMMMENSNNNNNENNTSNKNHSSSWDVSPWSLKHPTTGPVVVVESSSSATSNNSVREEDAFSSLGGESSSSFPPTALQVIRDFRRMYAEPNLNLIANHELKQKYDSKGSKEAFNQYLQDRVTEQY